jgi:hypothetical protein
MRLRKPIPFQTHVSLAFRAQAGDDSATSWPAGLNGQRNR